MRKEIKVFAVAAVAVVFAVGVALAGTKVDDIIKMENRLTHSLATKVKLVYAQSGKGKVMETVVQ